MIAVARRRFEELVADALDELPETLARAVENVAIVVEEQNPDEPELLGLYDGVALTDRSDYGVGELPDHIAVYRLPICAMCDSEAEVVEEVRVTVLHELAHYFGLDDDDLERLGWD